MNVEELLVDVNSCVFIKCPRSNHYNYIQEFETEHTDEIRWSISVKNQRNRINVDDIVLYLSNDDIFSAYKIKKIVNTTDNEYDTYFRPYWGAIWRLYDIIILEKSELSLTLERFNSKINPYTSILRGWPSCFTVFKKEKFNILYQNLLDFYNIENDSEEEEEEDFFSCDEYEGDFDNDIEQDDYSDIISNNTKFEILVKPCQSSKTQHVIDEIKKSDNKSIAFVDNSILQNDQFKSRLLRNEIKNLKPISNQDKKLSIDDIANIAKNLCYNGPLDGIDNIIGCSNYKQVDNTYNILKLVETINASSINKTKVDIYIDEIDSNFKLFQRIPEITEDMENLYEISNEDDETFMDFCEKSSCINKIFMVTATPEKVFKYFQENNKKLKLFYLKQTIDERYFQFSNAKFTLTNKSNKKLLFPFLKFILNNKNIKDDCNLFFPSKTAKKYHEHAKNILINNGFSVLVINSNGKILYHNNMIINVIDEFSDEFEKNNIKEISEIIAYIYKHYNLDKKRFAITGSICIGRGITINSPEFMITDAIYGDFLLNNKDNAVQTAMRICGNYKKWDIYNHNNRSHVYCSNKFYNTICTLEKTIINYVPKHNGTEYNHHNLFNNEKKRNNLEINDKNIECHETILYDEDIKELNKKVKEYKKQITSGKLKTGFSYKKNSKTLHTTTVTNKASVYQLDDLINELSNFSKKSNLDFKGKTNKWMARAYIAYENIDDPSTLCALVKVARLKDIEEINETNNDEDVMEIFDEDDT
jgi:hypothetical protein